MKNLPIYLMTLMVVLLGCSKEATITNDINQNLEINAVTAESILNPMMRYGPTTDFDLYVENFEYNYPKEKSVIDLRTFGASTFLPPGSNSCEEGEIEVVLEGEGTSYQIGNYVFSGGYCTLDGSTPAGPILGTITNDSGDSLYTQLVYASESPVREGYYQQDWIIYDGSGAYIEASGYLIMLIKFDYSNFTWDNFGTGLFSVE